MSTSKLTLEVSKTQVAVTFKDIKNLHISVYPPEGQVRVSAPLQYDEEQIRLAVIQRLTWIRKEQKRFTTADRQTKRLMVEGETHYVLGRRFRLRVIEQPGRTSFAINGNRLELCTPAESSRDYRFRKLEDWYRDILKVEIPPLISTWEKKLNVQVPKWTIRRMKTKWGSCNRNSRHIWFNLELAKKEPEAIEYIVVHEMMHYFETGHGDAFVALMDRNMADWRERRNRLDGSPLTEEKWSGED